MALFGSYQRRRSALGGGIYDSYLSPGLLHMHFNTAFNGMNYDATDVNGPSAMILVHVDNARRLRQKTQFWVECHLN